MEGWKTKHYFCFENVRDLPGYITEKIFDCFFAEYIPIYWGGIILPVTCPQTILLIEENLTILINSINISNQFQINIMFNIKKI